MHKYPELSTSNGYQKNTWYKTDKVDPDSHRHGNAMYACQVTPERYLVALPTDGAFYHVKVSALGTPESFDIGYDLNVHITRSLAAPDTKVETYMPIKVSTGITLRQIQNRLYHDNVAHNIAEQRATMLTGLMNVVCPAHEYEGVDIPTATVGCMGSLLLGNITDDLRFTNVHKVYIKRGDKSDIDLADAAKLRNLQLLRVAYWPVAFGMQGESANPYTGEYTLGLDIKG